MIVCHYLAGLHNYGGGPMRNIPFTTLENVSETDPFTHAPFTPSSPQLSHSPQSLDDRGPKRTPQPQLGWTTCECMCVRVYVCM